MKLGYVCTNYNNSKYTISAVDSLGNHNGGEAAIVVVDNGSNEENVEILRSLERSRANVNIILNRENIGYFKGLNCGIRCLRKIYKDVEYIIVGNNDLIFPEDFYESLAAKRTTLERHAVVSPKIRTADGVYQNPHVIKAIGRLRERVYDLYYCNYYVAVAIQRMAMLTGRYTDRRDEEQHEIAQEISQGYGACYILGPLFFQYYDELWAPTFMMGEELFLSVQLMKKGMKIYYEPAISVVHHCHASVVKMPRRQVWELSRTAHRLSREYKKTRV